MQNYRNKIGTLVFKLRQLKKHVAVLCDKLSPKSATIVASVDSVRSTAKSAVGSASSWRNSTAVATAWQPQSVPLFWRCVRSTNTSSIIHCETAVDLAQLISYSRRQLPVKEAIRNFYPIAQSRWCYQMTAIRVNMDLHIIISFCWLIPVDLTLKWRLVNRLSYIDFLLQDGLACVNNFVVEFMVSSYSDFIFDT